jgi:hypothetical protein
MRHRIATTAALLTLAVAAPAFTPSPSLAPLPALDTAEAAVTKSLNPSGGGNVGGAGNRLGDLLSGWGVPVMIAFAGILLVGTLASRNVGASVGIVLITLVGLIFLLSPASIESLAKGIANVVF